MGHEVVPLNLERTIRYIQECRLGFPLEIIMHSIDIFLKICAQFWSNLVNIDLVDTWDANGSVPDLDLELSRSQFWTGTI